MEIKNILALTKCTNVSDYEYFIVHVVDEHDEFMICNVREELFKHIKECYFNLVNRNLPIYGVKEEL